MAVARPSQPQTHRYGPHPDQHGELTLPVEEPRGTVVLLHGGFWREPWARDLMEPLAEDLAGAGWAAWNLEYRRLGGALGCGWPGMLEDVAAGIDALDGLGLAGGAVITVGHSAGGHLALWAAARPRLPAGAPGAEPRVRVTQAVAQGAVCDLAAASRLGLGRGAADELLGGPPEAVPERYAAASPAELLPLGVPLLVVHGADDDTVPASVAEGFAGAARAAGDDAELAVLPGVGHFEHLDPASGAWAAVRRRLEAA